MNTKEVKHMNTVRTPSNDRRFSRGLGTLALVTLFATATVFAQDPAPRQAPASDPQASQYPQPQAGQYPVPAAGQDQPQPYPQQAPYPQQGPYGQQQGYPQQQGPYGQQPAYGQQPQYGQPGQYGQQPQYGRQPAYQPQAPVAHPTSDLTLPAGTVISIRVDRPLSTARNKV